MGFEEYDTRMGALVEGNYAPPGAPIEGSYAPKGSSPACPKCGKGTVTEATKVGGDNRCFACGNAWERV